MKRRIKYFLIFIMMLMVIPLSSCLFNPVNDNNLNLVKKNVELVNLSNDYDIKDTNVDIYFYENGNVPLIDISTYYNMLEGFYDNSTRNVSKNTYFNKLYISDKSLSLRRVIFDWYHNTVTFKNTLNVCSIHENSNIDFSSYYDLELVKSINTLDIEYFLGDYNIDILFYNDLVLMPITFINFMNNTYYNVTYNGDKLYGFYYGDDFSVVKNNNTFTELKEDVKVETKNELLFLLNEKYGLKEYANVEDYYEYIGEDMWNDFVNGNSDTRDDFYFEVIDNMLNDPHSTVSVRDFSYYSNYPNNGKKYALNEGRYSNIGDTFKLLTDYRNQSEKAESPILFKENTLFITFDEFIIGQKNNVYDENGKYKSDAYLIDTPALFYKALTDAKENHPEVENVVIDVSINGGGYIAAMYKILSFMSNDIYTGYAVSETEYEVYKILGDTNMDEIYDEDESFGRFNYYILESGGTFSAANALACHAKYNKVAKTIGKRSGGGMCAVMPYILTDGTRFNLSDKNAQIAIINDNGNYKKQEIESGAPVDIPLEYSDFYNLDKILELINA